MSVFRITTTTMRRTLLPCTARALSSYKNVTATLKDAAKAVDHTAARAALKGLEAAEQVRNVVGSGVKGAAGKTAETGGRAAGTAREFTGEAAGKAAETGGRAAGTAKEFTGEAAGKAAEMSGKAAGAAKEYSGAAAGKANELTGKAKGAYSESRP